MTQISTSARFKRVSLVLIPILFAAWLLTAGFVDFRRDHLDAALIQAVNQGDAAQADRLLASGADPNTRNWNTYRPVGTAPFQPPWYEKYLAKLMRRKPRQPDAYVGPTVLMIAASHGDSVMARCLLDHGADTARTGTNVEDDREDNGYVVPPLWEAAKGIDAATVEALLKHGAPVDERGGGLTPLMVTDNLDFAAALINEGADVNAVSLEPLSDDYGETVLERAIKGEAGQASGDNTANLKLTALLLEKGAKANFPDASGGTALIAACQEDSLEAAKFLLDYGADVNAHDQQSRGTAIIYCTYTLDIEKLLLKHRASVNAADKNGDTALINAAEHGQTQTLTLLLAAGASPNQRNAKGQTALMLASHLDYDYPEDWQKERQARIHLLLHSGANPNLQDKQVRTAAHYFNRHPPDPPGS